MHYYYFVNRQGIPLMNFKNKVFEFCILDTGEEVHVEDCRDFHTHAELQKWGERLANRSGQCVFVIRSSKKVDTSHVIKPDSELLGVWCFNLNSRHYPSAGYSALNGSMFERLEQFEDCQDERRKHLSDLDPKDNSKSAEPSKVLSESERVILLLERGVIALEKIAATFGKDDGVEAG